MMKLGPWLKRLLPESHQVYTVKL